MQSSLGPRRIPGALVLTRRFLLASVAVGSCVFGSAALGQTITSIDPGMLSRSGRLLVFGNGFGAADPQSVLLVDGLPAIATTWTDTEIHGYVPEAANLGTVPVQVVTQSGSSNTVNLVVTSREGDGRVRWRFRTDDSVIGYHLTIGPDGTIYTSDKKGMYALSSDGALLWFQSKGRGGRQIGRGADGTLYTGMVVAIAPDGSFLWEYTPPDTGPSMLAGPGVGSDGNVYGVQDPTRGGLGAFSVDPLGNLLWQSKLSPDPNADLNNAYVQFGVGDRFYFGVAALRSGPYPRTYGFHENGSQFWTQDGTCSTGPVLDPTGRIVIAGVGNCGITQFDEDGNEIWNALPPWSFVFPVGPAVGPDSSVYVADWTGGAMWSVDSSGNTRWALGSDSKRGMMKNTAVTPDNRYFLDGGRLTFGVPGWIKAYETADGSPAWQVDLPRENGMDQETYSNPRFSPTGEVAYYNTSFFGNGPGYAYVYAIDVCGEQASWNNYGAGWPGTLGVPALTAQSDPVLGQDLNVDLGNSRGANTTAWMLVGFGSASVATKLGGTLLVDPLLTIRLSVPAVGSVFHTTMPSDPAFCGLSVYSQALQLDPGASKGVSFTAGLELVLGH